MNAAVRGVHEHGVNAFGDIGFNHDAGMPAGDVHAGIEGLAAGVLLGDANDLGRRDPGALERGRLPRLRRSGGVRKAHRRGKPGQQARAASLCGQM